MLIVHLSDIHFRDQDGDDLDPNAHLRRELEKDLRWLRTQFKRPFDVLAITGDIAHSGKPAEFLVAKSWIKALCELVDCPPEGVMVTPGNHDVDRSVVSSSGELMKFHAEIRSKPVAAIDGLLTAALREQESGDRLMFPLAAYNQFAQQYGCQSVRTHPWWDKRLEKSKNSTVLFRGLNTALISGPADHFETGRLVAGTRQCTFADEDGVVRVVMGHHPPVWLRDQETVERTLTRYAALQLFGHRHEQWIDRLDNSVRLFSGALHPDRTEGNWVPRYNVIELTWLEDGRLRITVWPRKWFPEEGVFGADFDSQARPTRELFHSLRQGSSAGAAATRLEQAGSVQPTRADGVTSRSSDNGAQLWNRQG